MTAGKTINEVLKADMRLIKSSPQSADDRQATVAHFEDVQQTIAHTMPNYDVRISRFPFQPYPKKRFPMAMTNH